MPIRSSTFKPPRLLRSPHLQTIVPALLRKQRPPPMNRSWIELPDGDALEIALTPRLHARLAIISHGLEGSMSSSYVIGMVRALRHEGWDVLTWNMRGCGGTPNRLPTWYHSGKSEDLRAILDHALSFNHEEIVLVGFSVGGNITLKYLGENGACVPVRVRKAVAISVPMDLRGSAEQLALPRNRIYMEYLLKPLRARMKQKAMCYPELFSIKGLSSITTFKEFDERFTAPFHGFSSVDHYWDDSSSLKYLTGITIPTLAITALDDPFLSATCIPHVIAETLPMFQLETSEHGGHVGFLNSYSLASTWAEARTVSFMRESEESLVY